MTDQVVIRDSARRRWLRFREPVEVIVARDASEVAPALDRVARSVEERRLYAAGFLAYEAAPAFDAALQVRPCDGALPLLWFGLYRAADELDQPPFERLGAFEIGDWQWSLPFAEYGRAIATIKELIASGDTYQVNFTVRLRSRFMGDARALFAALERAQQAPCGAFIDIGSHAICSASPELFFDLDGETLTCRPMKGTAPRGRTLAEDEQRISGLGASEKDRAENVMILDMVRNDLGRIAEVAGVRVLELCGVERYPTVLQMTSTVAARTRASLVDIMTALFPSASVTGAPKVRTMEIIRRLESGPRGVYTGAIGFIAPGRRAHFNVAIRTAVVDRAAGRIEYGVGGGVVWDSSAEDEYRECQVKARILTRPRPEFDVLETLLWAPAGGYFLLDRHLRRLGEAATYFARPFDEEWVRSELLGSARGLPARPHRVRLLVGPGGGISVAATPLADSRCAPLRVGRAAMAVDSSDPFLYFKTTHRVQYEQALASRPDCDDVVLWNECGEATESTTANLVVRIDGALVTPPIDCGLLAGTYRAELLERGRIGERVVRVDDLANVEAMYLINSVRRCMTVVWVDEGRSRSGDSGLG